MSPEVSGAVRVSPSRGCNGNGASDKVRRSCRSRHRISPAVQNRSRTIGLWPLLGYKTVESPAAQKRLGFAATFPQDVSTVPGRVPERLRTDQGPRCAQIVPTEWKKKIRHWLLDLDARIDSTLFSSAVGARELYERFSTFMDRFYVGRWKRWVFIEPLSEAATIGLGGPDPDAGAGGAGVPRNRRRGLAEEIRSRGDVSRPLRQSDRQPRHQAQ